MKKRTLIFIFIFLILVNTTGLYALRFGPDEILQCPACDHIMKVKTIASGNTYGGRYRTDGYTNFPMYPGYPEITKCDECGSILWREEFTILGEMPSFADQYRNEEVVYPESWEKAKYIDFLTLDEHNDVNVQNLERIIKLLENDTSASSYIMRAEAYRELGHFEEATNICSSKIVLKI